MPVQIGLSNDERHRELVEACDSGNGNNEFDHRTRRDTSGRRQQRRHVVVSDASVASGGYSSGGSNSSSSSGGGMRSSRLTSSLGDMPPPMFPVFPQYRSVGTQTIDELFESDSNDDDFHRCSDDDVDGRGTSLNDESVSYQAVFGGVVDLAGFRPEHQKDQFEDVDDAVATNLEITLRKETIDEKIGLTLFYRNFGNDSTCAYVGEVSPDGIAARDGRIQRGDQIIKVDGAVLRSRDEALQMFSRTRGLSVTLSIARRGRWHWATDDAEATAVRQQLQLSGTDDGFLEDSLDHQQQLLVSLQRRVPVPSYYMLANTLECIDEEEADNNEDGTTDDTTDFSGSNRHEDSGVGRTDDSTRNEESSEQELPDMDCTASLGSRRCARRLITSQYQSEEPCADDDDDDDRDVSAADDDERQEVVYDDEGPSPVQCQQFYAMLKERCNAGMVLKILPPSLKNDDREHSLTDRDSDTSPNRRLSIKSRSADEVSPDHRLIPIADSGRCCTAISDPAIASATPNGRRSVPRMGTRLDATVTTPVGSSNTPTRPPLVSLPAVPAPSRLEAVSLSSLRTPTVDTSLFNNFSLQTPPNRVFQRFIADVDSSPSSTTTIVDSRLSPQQPEVVAEAVGHGTPVAEASPTSSNDRAEAYRRCGADVMLTNRANLKHTIALQQTLFQQQLTADSDNAKRSTSLALQPCSSSSSEKIDSLQIRTERPASSPSGHAMRPNDLPLPISKPPIQSSRQDGTRNGISVQQSSNQSSSHAVCTAAGEPEVKMEWVVKRRSDGTRYVTRRPVKTETNGGGSRRHSKQPGPPPTASRDQRTKVRGREAAEQRWAAAAASVRHEVACSTDDDDGSSAVVSELKVGRYWTREQRRQHVEQRREREALKHQKKADAAARIVSMTALETAARFKSASNGQQRRPTLRSDSATFEVGNEFLAANAGRATSGRHGNRRGTPQQHENRQLLSVTTV